MVLSEMIVMLQLKKLKKKVAILAVLLTGGGGGESGLTALFYKVNNDNVPKFAPFQSTSKFHPVPSCSEPTVRITAEEGLGKMGWKGKGLLSVPVPLLRSRFRRIGYL